MSPAALVARLMRAPLAEPVKRFGSSDHQTTVGSIANRCTALYDSRLAPTTPSRVRSRLSGAAHCGRSGHRSAFHALFRRSVVAEAEVPPAFPRTDRGCEAGDVCPCPGVFEAEERRQD